MMNSTMYAIRSQHKYATHNSSHSEQRTQRHLFFKVCRCRLLDCMYTNYENYFQYFYVCSILCGSFVSNRHENGEWTCQNVYAAGTIEPMTMYSLLFAFRLNGEIPGKILTYRAHIRVPIKYSSLEIPNIHSLTSSG